MLDESFRLIDKIDLETSKGGFTVVIGYERAGEPAYRDGGYSCHLIESNNPNIIVFHRSCDQGSAYEAGFKKVKELMRDE